VLIIRRSKLYYAASGIITPVGGRPFHRLREDLCIKLVNFQDYTEMHGQQNIKPQNKYIISSNSKAYYLSTFKTKIKVYMHVPLANNEFPICSYNVKNKYFYLICLFPRVRF